MSKGDSKDGWVAYVARYKEKYPERVDTIDYKELMKTYIGGIPV